MFLHIEFKMYRSTHIVYCIGISMNKYFKSCFKSNKFVT